MSAGFWIRGVAVAIDLLVLGFVGAAIAVPLRSSLDAWGNNGQWIGFLVTWGYLTLLQSGRGGGATVGQRLLKLQVVRIDGGFLTVSQAAARGALVVAMLYGQWLLLVLGSSYPILQQPDLQESIAVAWMAYGAFLIFSTGMHPLKRGFHDLAVGSRVVRRGTLPNAAAVPGRTQPRLLGAVALTLLIVAIGVVTTRSVAASLPWQSLLEIRHRIEDGTHLREVAVMRTHNVWFGKRRSTINANSSSVTM